MKAYGKICITPTEKQVNTKNISSHFLMAGMEYSTILAMKSMHNSERNWAMVSVTNLSGKKRALLKATLVFWYKDWKAYQRGSPLISSIGWILAAVDITGYLTFGESFHNLLARLSLKLGFKLTSFRDTSELHPLIPSQYELIKSLILLAELNQYIIFRLFRRINSWRKKVPAYRQTFRDAVGQVLKVREARMAEGKGD
jgi:hypothetical protein